MNVGSKPLVACLLIQCLQRIANVVDTTGNIQQLPETHHSVRAFEVTRAKNDWLSTHGAAPPTPLLGEHLEELFNVSLSISDVSMTSPEPEPESMVYEIGGQLTTLVQTVGAHVPEPVKPSAEPRRSHRKIREAAPGQELSMEQELGVRSLKRKAGELASRRKKKAAKVGLKEYEEDRDEGGEVEEEASYVVEEIIGHVSTISL